MFLFREVGFATFPSLRSPRVTRTLTSRFFPQSRALLPRLGQLSPRLPDSEEERPHPRSSPGEERASRRGEIGAPRWLPLDSGGQVARYSAHWQASGARGCYSAMGQPVDVQLRLSHSAEPDRQPNAKRRDSIPRLPLGSARLHLG